jgi:hypothetical protein
VAGLGLVERPHLRAAGGYGIGQRVFLVLSSIWVLVTAVGLLPQPVAAGGRRRQPG